MPSRNGRVSLLALKALTSALLARGSRWAWHAKCGGGTVRACSSPHLHTLARHDALSDNEEEAARVMQPRSSPHLHTTTQDDALSDSQEEAARVMQLGGLARNAVKLFRGMDFEISDGALHMSAITKVPFLKVWMCRVWGRTFPKCVHRYIFTFSQPIFCQPASSQPAFNRLASSQPAFSKACHLTTCHLSGMPFNQHAI